MPDSADQKTALHFPATIVLINMIKLIYLKGYHIPNANILPVTTFRPRSYTIHKTKSCQSLHQKIKQFYSQA